MGELFLEITWVELLLCLAHDVLEKYLYIDYYFLF